MTFPREGKFTSSHFFASKDVLGIFRAQKSLCRCATLTRTLPRTFPEPCSPYAVESSITVEHEAEHRGLYRVLFRACFTSVLGTLARPSCGGAPPP